MAVAHRQRWLLLLLLAVLACVCSLEVALGAFPTRIYGHDLFVFLNGAWRVASGQIPCVDFYSGLGVLVWKPIQWAFVLHGYNADAIGLARAFYTAVLGVWFLLLIWREPVRIRSVVLWFFFLIFVSAARPLGEYPTWISHAMFYNRVGYALVFLVMFEQLPVSRFRAEDSGSHLQPKLEFWGGLSTGVALACTVLLKISFVAPAAAMLGLGLLFFGVNRRHLSGLVTGLLAVFVLAVTCLRFQPGAFLRETVILGHVREGLLRSEVVLAVVEDLGQVVFTLAAGLVIATTAFVNRRVALKYMLATLVIVGCDIFCRATSAMRGDLPLAAFWCLSGVALLLSVPSASEEETTGVMSYLRPRFIIPLLVLSPMVLPILAKDLTSSAYAAFETAAMRRHEALRFDSGALSSWIPLDWQGEEASWLDENGKALVLITNDGLHLLRRLSGPNETIAAISFVNPFSFALGRRPPEGGAVWFDPNNNVSQYHPFPIEMMIGRPDLLMVQNSIDAETADIKAIFANYPDLLTKDYGLVASSEYWSLYRRRAEQPHPSLAMSNPRSDQQPGVAFR